VDPIWGAIAELESDREFVHGEAVVSGALPRGGAQSVGVWREWMVVVNRLQYSVDVFLGAVPVESRSEDRGSREQCIEKIGLVGSFCKGDDLVNERAGGGIVAEADHDLGGVSLNLEALLGCEELLCHSIGSAQHGQGAFVFVTAGKGGAEIVQCEGEFGGGSVFEDPDGLAVFGFGCGQATTLKMIVPIGKMEMGV